MKVAIYGIFDHGKCIYVGRTQNPKARRARHQSRFGKATNFVILKEVPLKVAARAERELIQAYRSIGQARKNSKGVQVLIEPEQVKKLLRLTKANSRTLADETNEAIKSYGDFRSVWISQPLHHRLKFAAARNEVGLSEFIEQILDQQTRKYQRALQRLHQTKGQ